MLTPSRHEKVKRMLRIADWGIGLLALPVAVFFQVSGDHRSAMLWAGFAVLGLTLAYLNPAGKISSWMLKTFTTAGRKEHATNVKRSCG